MAAAEDINSPRLADGLDVIRRLALAVNRAACEPRAEHRFVQLGKAQPVRLVERSHRGNFPVLHPADEPRVLSACQKLQNGLDKFQIARVFVIEKAEVGRDAAAADHADIVHLIGRETKRLTIGSARPEQLHCLLGRNALDCAAADGPKRLTVLKHRHLRARASGG